MCFRRTEYRTRSTTGDTRAASEVRSPVTSRGTTRRGDAIDAALPVVAEFAVSRGNGSPDAFAPDAFAKGGGMAKGCFVGGIDAAGARASAGLEPTAGSTVSGGVSGAWEAVFHARIGNSTMGVSLASTREGFGAKSVFRMPGVERGTPMRVKRVGSPATVRFRAKGNAPVRLAKWRKTARSSAAMGSGSMICGRFQTRGCSLVGTRSPLSGSLVKSTH